MDYSTNFATNLLGRKIRMVNDEDARQEGRKHNVPEADGLTRGKWYTGVDRYQAYWDEPGTIVAVYTSKGKLVLMIEFGGELVADFPPGLIRLQD